MKTTTKRSLACLMLVVMLLTLLPLSAFAADSYSYHFGGWANDGDNVAVGAGPADGTKSWELVAKSDGTGTGKSINVKTGKNNAGTTYLRWKNQDDKSFVVFKLTGIAEGTYTMSFQVNGSAGGAAANIYVMPASQLPATTAEIETKLAGMQSVGKVGSYKKSGVTDPDSISGVSFSGSSDGSYAVAFLATKNAGDLEIKTTTFMLSGINLTEGGASTPAPSTPAEDGKIRFDFTSMVTEGSMDFEAYEKTNTGRNWDCSMYSYGTFKAYPGYSEYAPVIEDDYYLWEYRFWTALTLYNIPAGVYTMDLELAENTDKVCPVEVYVIPRAQLSKLNTSGPMGLMQKNSPVATIDSNKTSASLTNLQMADDPNNSYLVMFNFLPAVAGKELESLDGTSIKLKSITLTSTGAATPAPTTPAATNPGNDIPADESVIGTITGAPLFDYEIAAADAISTSYYTHAAKGIVNGHDYLYLMVKGTKLLVFDVDDKKLVDTEPINTSTPRRCYVDENGILWMVASAQGLYRYDPFTGVLEYLPTDIFGKSVSNFYGVTGDGNGKIYFGTYAEGQLGMYDTATKKFTKLSNDLITDPTKPSDIKHAGYGGLVYKDGFIYVGVDGDMNNDGYETHMIIKFDVAKGKIVDKLDISHCLLAENKYLYCLNLVDNVLFGSIYGHLNSAVTIDITAGDGNGDGIGDTMQFITLKDLETGHTSEITEVVDGKVYFVGYHGPNQTKGFVEYDIATKTSKLLKAGMEYAVRLEGGSMVTIEGDDRLPGQSIMIPINNEASSLIDLGFFNPQTKEYVVWESIIGASGGVGISLRSPTTDNTGKYIYIGAYGNNMMSQYSIEEGKVVASFPSYGHQTDRTMFYNGKLYAGNYSAATITEIDPETFATNPLFTLRYSVFDQCRMWCLEGGDNKVFAGTTPYMGYGGMLAWYDYSNGLTYVAGGPSPQDVYYCDMRGFSENANFKFTWYNAVTGELADFDHDDDGNEDYFDENGYQYFTGPIEYQVINNLIYKDGLLYGTTSAYGSSGNGPEFHGKNAVLFVYDVAAMKVICTYDLSNGIGGFTGQIPLIDQLEADPDIDGKFWGVVSNTLFSATYDKKTNTFSVKEELTFGKDEYSLPGAAWAGRDLIMDGEYMYVGFARNTGLFMVRRDNPAGEYYYLANQSMNQMTLAADGNLYCATNSADETNNLYVLRIAEYTAPLKDKAAVESVINRINAISDKVTRADQAAIELARKTYDKLTDEQKARVTNIDKLLAAEAAFAELPTFNMTILYVAIAAVVVLAGAAVAVVIVLKKKKQNNASDAE